MKRRFLALCLALLMLLALCPAASAVPSAPQRPILSGQSGIHTNPLYPDAVPSGDLGFPDGEYAPDAASSAYYGTVEEAAEDIRGYMRSRTENFTVYLRYVSDDASDVVEEINQASADAFELALAHTGVPVEGDYLRWHWGEWANQWNASSSGNVYNVTIDFAISYYTTAAQEQRMDTAVDDLLEELDLEGESDYQKIRTIYDYLCENVTYDNENLNNQNHTLKFTAYAALIDGTAVCQGYASLFYRLALTLGVDARLIAGDAGGPHAWNIARLNDLYYNLDSTWDAGVSEYRYFLVSDAHFTDHHRYMDYATEAFYAQYPMSETDYDPGSDPSHTHSYTAAVTDPTCTEDGYTTYSCSCGDTYRDSILPALGHAEVTDPAVAPTCTETGLTEGSHCNRCGQILIPQEVLEAAGHQWDEGVVTIEPTETESGLMTFTCTVCGETKTKILPDLNHVHSYEAVVTPPTCTEPGFTTYFCPGCEDSYVDSEVAPLGHSETIDPAVEPSCTGTGLTAGSHCAVCGVILIPQESIPATGHHPGPWTVVVEPTGTADGTEERRCPCGKTEHRSIPKLENPFTDVKRSDYFFEPVLWASSKGITSGITPTRFGPAQSCTRGQVVTFLWRAAGQPEPASANNPFNDVKASAFYYKAVLWAVEEGITAGTSAASFSPNSPCTRAQVVTFLWRSAGQPEPESGKNTFSDVKSTGFYYNAVLWAVEKGITTGTGAGKFSPSQTCTRGQVVTFLYRGAR